MSCHGNKHDTINVILDPQVDDFDDDEKTDVETDSDSQSDSASDSDYEMEEEGSSDEDETEEISVEGSFRRADPNQIFVATVESLEFLAAKFSKV